MRCTRRWRTTSSPPNRTKSVLDLAQDVGHDDEPRVLVARQVDLRDVAGDDHPRPEPQARGVLHLLGRRVLRLVEDHEGIVQRPSAREGATSMTRAPGCAATFSGSIMSCSASKSGRRYGSILAIMSPGGIEALARLDRGA